MAQPYQDLQGNWFVGGRPMAPQELELYRQLNTQGQQAPQQQVPGQTVPGQAPTHPSAMNPIVAAQIEAERMKRIRENSLGAGIDFAFGGLN